MALRMIVILAIIVGLALGDWRARRFGGDRKDRIQYAIVHALAFSLIGVFASILIERWMAV